jgi:hypothetical protein
LERPGVLRSVFLMEGAGEAPPDAILLFWCNDFFCGCFLRNGFVDLRIECVALKLKKLLSSCPQYIAFDVGSWRRVSRKSRAVGIAISELGDNLKDSSE